MQIPPLVWFLGVPPDTDGISLNAQTSHSSHRLESERCWGRGDGGDAPLSLLLLV